MALHTIEIEGASYIYKQTVSGFSEFAKLEKTMPDFILNDEVYKPMARLFCDLKVNNPTFEYKFFDFLMAVSLDPEIIGQYLQCILLSEEEISKTPDFSNN